MKMIDEEVEESSDQSDKMCVLPEDFVKGGSISDSSIGEKDFYNSWQLVHDRKERQNQKQATKINLRDLTESDFLELTEAKNSDKRRQHQKQATINLRDLTESDFLGLIEAKNQDKRFYSWLNF